MGCKKQLEKVEQTATEILNTSECVKFKERHKKMDEWLKSINAKHRLFFPLFPYLFTCFPVIAVLSDLILLQS